MAEGLSTDQRTELLDIIKQYAAADLGPLIKDIVGEQLEASQKASQTNFAEVIANLTERKAPADSEETVKQSKGLMLGRLCRSLAAAKGDPSGALAFAKKQWGEKDAVVAVYEKALAAGDAVGGGFIVPPGYSEDIIELLRPNVLVRSLGAVSLPMPNGSLQVPKLVSGSASAYVGENEDITESQPTFGLINLTAKKLATLVPMSNDLLRFSRPSADAIVRDDIVRAMQTKEDLQFIRGIGSQFAPTSIKAIVDGNGAGSITANATVNLANVTVDIGKLVLALVEANVSLIRPGFMMAPRTWNFLMTIRDGNGNFAFRDEMLQGRLWGYPFGITTQIPINLGGGVDESELYFVDFADVVIGESLNMSIDVSQEAAYVSGGSLVSAFSRDQTVIRVIAEHDLGMRHDESASYLDTLVWV